MYVYVDHTIYLCQSLWMWESVNRYVFVFIMYHMNQKSNMKLCNEDRNSIRFIYENIKRDGQEISSCLLISSFFLQVPCNINITKHITELDSVTHDLWLPILKGNGRHDFDHFRKHSALVIGNNIVSPIQKPFMVRSIDFIQKIINALTCNSIKTFR